MRRRAIALSILTSTAVLAIGYQVGIHAHQAATVVDTTAGASTGSTSGSSNARPGSNSSNSSGPTTPTSGSVSGTFAGASERTPYGNVQVQIAVSSGTITDVTALQLTNQDQRSVSISNRAAPILRQEVLAAQSANVQGVSGATYTSDGYLSSLQAALDQAGL